MLRRSRIVLGAGLLALGGGIAWFAAHGESLPDRATLQSAIGHVHSVEKRRTSVVFRLGRESCAYSYAAKGGRLDGLADGLENAEDAPVEVLYAVVSETLCPVYEVRVGRRPLRTYDETRDSWKKDDLAGVVLGIGLVIGGIALLVPWRALRARKLESDPN